MMLLLNTCWTSIHSMGLITERYALPLQTMAATWSKHFRSYKHHQQWWQWWQRDTKWQFVFVKLHAYGIAGVLLQWLQNLFSCRTIQTRINDLLSDVCNLLCGVIQGSVIGPLMFLVYINDLVELLASFNIKVKLFADNVKLYVRVVSVTDTTTLQKALTALVSWADEWQLSVSVEKCCVTH